MERHRRELLADLHPIRLDVVHVVEHEARDRDDLQVREARRRGQVRELCLLGVERERNEPEEAARLVLQRADAHEVIDAVLDRLDAAVEHRDVRLDAVLMAELRDLEPAFAGDLVAADDVAHTLLEDLGAAAGAGVHPGGLEFADDRHDVLLRDAGDPVDLDHRPRLEMDAGKPRLERAEEIEIPGIGKRRVETADDVELRDAVVPARRGLRHGLLDRHRVTAVHARLPRPCAQRAVYPAEVRGIQVTVDVVVGRVAVLRLADVVRERADAQNVQRPEERDPVLEREAPAFGDLLGDGAEGRPGEALEEGAQSGMSPVEIGREMAGGACCSSTALGFSSSYRPA